MGILTWIILGLVAGVIAKFVLPFTSNLGLITTIVLGIIGAVVGGYLSTLLGFGTVNNFSVQSVLIAAAGAIVVLLAYRLVCKK